MAGLKRRIRVEGWALDVPDGEEAGYKSAVQRVGDNNKLWIVMLIVVVVVSGFLMHQARGGGPGEKEGSFTPPQAAVDGDYRNQEHQDFAKDFVKNQGKDGMLIEASFVNNRKFAFVVPGDKGADDIEYVSKMAAQYHLARFKTWAKIEAYQRSAGTGRDTLRATTSWVASRYGFVVKFIDQGK